METIAVLAAAVAVLGLLAAIGSIWWMGHANYRITSSHLEVVLPRPLPSRRFRLVELEGARVLDRGGGVWGCIWFNVILAAHVWDFLLGRFENWGGSLCGQAVMISRTGGRSVLVTPPEPGRFAQELMAAIEQARFDEGT